MEIPNNYEGLIIEHRHRVFCRVRNLGTGEITQLPIPQAEKILGNVFYYDWFTHDTKFIINSEKGYEILKLGDQNWRPLQPNFRKDQIVLMSNDRKKMLFFYCLVHQGSFDLRVTLFDLRTEEYETIRNFPRNIFCDVTKQIPFYWESDPAIGELSKENGLRVLVMKNDYSWNEQVIEISSAFLNHHLITMKFFPIDFVNGILWFQCNGNRKYYFCYHIVSGSVIGYVKALFI
ncbi:hypothetical protein F8388_024174 [Cannabis sativa]|uniref:F-box protein n=1 Tax=Cannabis sativa TaxID=3483 RepID=A0A7J6FXT8_CANSA|nr:hypothetical protein F8388_024174 [Cannabis sativa]